MPTYQPNPPSTDAVMSDPRLRQIVDEMAESIHDAWAAERIKQGWTYGETTARNEKIHASLIPFAQLSESEKDIDRAVAATALAALVKLGIVVNPHTT